MVIQFSLNPRNDEHIQDVQKEWDDWKKLHEDALIGGTALLVVHTRSNYTDLKRWIEIDQSGGGVLFIAGAPTGEHASLKKQLAEGSHGWPPRWHVLTTPLSGTDAGSELGARFGRFLRSCAGLSPHGVIPWEELYSFSVSENVLSIYLWCLARPTLAKKGITAPKELIKIAEDAWLDLSALNRERGITIPARSEIKDCLELNSEACGLFTSWFKSVLLPGLA